MGTDPSASGVRQPVSAKPRGVRRYAPILDWLPHYDQRWLVSDAVAGLSVWALLVPQALAYATIAGVPVQYGLYTAFVALIAYAIFGTSRHLIQGPSAAVAAVSAAVVAPIVGASAMNTSAAVGYTAALALAAGALYLVLGFLKMGWISNFLSKAVMAGFVLGFSFGIIIDQLYKLFGVSKPEGSYLQKLWGTLEELGDTSGATLAVGVCSLAALLGMRYAAPKVPRALVVVALSIIVVSAFDLQSRGVSVTGDVPTGLFSVELPGVGWNETNALAIGALSIIFVGFSESLASARAMALKHRYEIDTNNELIAQGMASGAAGFVGGFATDGSLSKTSVADAAGQKTQMASLINAGFVLLTMLLLASLFENLPSATLGAVVIDAMIGLITFSELTRYYRVNRPDWVFFMGAMIGILVFGIIQGIAIGVALSLLLLIARVSTTPVRPLRRDPGTGSFFAASQDGELEKIPGVLVVRVDGPLFFADASRFRETLTELVRQEDGKLEAVVIDADSVQLTDTDGADILIQVRGELEAEGTSLVLARVRPEVLALWRRAGLAERNGSGQAYATVREAVAAVAKNDTSMGDSSR